MGLRVRYRSLGYNIWNKHWIRVDLRWFGRGGNKMGNMLTFSYPWSVRHKAMSKVFRYWIKRNRWQNYRDDDDEEQASWLILVTSSLYVWQDRAKKIGDPYHQDIWHSIVLRFKEKVHDSETLFRVHSFTRSCETVCVSRTTRLSEIICKHGSVWLDTGTIDPLNSAVV